MRRRQNEMVTSCSSVRYHGVLSRKATDSRMKRERWGEIGFLRRTRCFAQHPPGSSEKGPTHNPVLLMRKRRPLWLTRAFKGRCDKSPLSQLSKFSLPPSKLLVFPAESGAEGWFATYNRYHLIHFPWVALCHL